MEIGVTKTTTTALPSSTVGGGPAAASLTSAGGAIIATVERSSPLNMPLGAPIGATAAVSTAGRSGVPVLIESGSYSKSAYNILYDLYIIYFYNSFAAPPSPTPCRQH